MNHSMTRSCLALTFLLLTVGLAAPFYGQITPSADAYTDTAAPTTNYGAQPLLNVDGATQITFIEFNLASIPSGATISKATLKLYVNSVTAAGSFNIDYVNGTWTESKIDHSNAPALGGAIASSIPITTAQKNQYVLVDITSAVKAWQSGGQANDGIALVANGSFNAAFDSKENTTTSHPPEVDVVFAGGGGGGTITGITTSTGSGLQGGGTSGKLNLSLNTSCASGQGLAWNGSAWACQSFKGSGSVASVGLSAPSSDFTVSGSPVTGSGTLGLNWAVAPTNIASANSIVKRDSTGSFNAGSITASGTVSAATLSASVFDVNNINANGTVVAQTLGVNGNAVVAGVMGIGTNFAQAELNLNSGSAANADTLLIGNNTSKGLQMRDNGNGVDLESIGVPLYVNFVTQQPAYINPNGGPVYLGAGATTISSVPSALNVGSIDNNGSFMSAAFSNDVDIFGNFLVGGTKFFRIDHPLDPTNKYLLHASIESSEVLNQYSGNVVLDGKGEARVEFPDWFPAVNTDYRYQLTAIGAPAPSLYIAEEITDRSFRIAGGHAGMKVSWQVIARRNDPYMKAHPMVVEQEKPKGAHGRYDHPELYGAPPEMGMWQAAKNAATQPTPAKATQATLPK